MAKNSDFDPKSENFDTRKPGKPLKKISSKVYLGVFRPDESIKMGPETQKSRFLGKTSISI